MSDLSTSPPNDEETPPQETVNPDELSIEELVELDNPDNTVWWRRGVLAWFTQNSVAANLLMMVLMVGGLAMSTQIKQEVFPDFELDIVNVQIPYPGASPSEVEQGVLLVTEEAVRGLDGVKRVTSIANEGVGTVSVELLLGADPDRVLADVKSSVDRITSFPEEAERPTSQLAAGKREVISIVVHGDDISESSLRALAEDMRDEMLELPNVTQAEITGARAPEISIEIPQDTLRKYNLTIPQISQVVQRASIDLPGGSIKADGGEVLLRTKERRDTGPEFSNIVVLSQPDGTLVRLGDISNVRDTFADTDIESRFDGKQALLISVYRVGDQTPIEVADAVKGYMEKKQSQLPPGVGLTLWKDQSRIYKERIELLLNNAYIGLILVFGALGLFLNFRLAFWVTMGIPISFLGSLLLMPLLGATINMISLFAFIVTLGMVVDDAIVVGENIFSMREQGLPPMKAAIIGVRKIAVPVTFSITTTIVAFSPLFFVPGAMGKIFVIIPIIVVSVLLISLFESLFVLPAHLSHTKIGDETGIMAVIDRGQRKFSDGLNSFIKNVYQPFVRLCMRWRYLSIALGLAMLIGTAGLAAGGRIPFTFFPKIDGDQVTASIRLPVGTPLEDSRQIRAYFEESLRDVLRKNGGMDKANGIYSQIGQAIPGGGPPSATIGNSGSHIVDVSVSLVPSDQRDFNASDLAKKWRERAGDVPGLDSLTFKYSTGPSSGNPIDIQLSHPNSKVLEAAAEDMAEQLQQYSGVIDINDGIAEGKKQLDFTLTPTARSMGLTESDLALQLRGAFFGSEALRQQRGRDEVRVMVRLPEDQRRSDHTLNTMLLRTPQGGEITLAQAANLREGRAYTQIKRFNSKRVLNVTADLAPGAPTANEILRNVQKDILPDLLAKYDGLTYSLEGERREQNDTLGALGTGAAMALLIIFALLAIPFKSYFQPVIIMSAIPFGIVGAFLGHAVMGMELSIMSMMGLVALSGIVVNDSLVLVVTINENIRDRRMRVLDAVVDGAMSRFRPILLTSVTTFLGLAPMVLETSVQARFLIPMAISLAFGVIFATFIILVIVPASYIILEDIKRLLPFVQSSYASDRDYDIDDHTTHSNHEPSSQSSKFA